MRSTKTTTTIIQSIGARGASASVVLALEGTHELVRGMASGREMDLLPTLQNIKRLEGALYAAALDPSGKILAHTTGTEKGKTRVDEFTKAALKANEPRLRKSSAYGEPVLIITVPVWVHPPASVIVTVYEPEASPDAVALFPPEGDHA